MNEKDIENREETMMCKPGAGGMKLIEGIDDHGESESSDNKKEIVHLDRISNEQFEVLYAVGFWDFTTLDYVTGISDELGVSRESVLQILEDLEGKKYLTIMKREDKIFTAELTENGNLIFHHPDYQKIKEELGL